MSNYSEPEIVEEALKIIGDNPGIHTSEMIDKAREIMQPDGDDLTILKDRNDDKFSQKVRNIKCHDSIKEKVITVGEKTVNGT